MLLSTYLESAMSYDYYTLFYYIMLVTILNIPQQILFSKIIVHTIMVLLQIIAKLCYT